MNANQKAHKIIMSVITQAVVPEGLQQKHSTPSSEDSKIPSIRSTKPSAITEFSL